MSVLHAQKAEFTRTLNHGDDYLLLDRDLLDQQIIDVDGRKVVRVNDVNLALGARRAQQCCPESRHSGKSKLARAVPLAVCSKACTIHRRRRPL